MTPQLCLGTAQFGLSYGITNDTGKVSEDQIKKILARAANSDVLMLDTAQVYGDAEALIGKCKPSKVDFSITTKLAPTTKPSFVSDDVETWNESLLTSLQNLNVDQIDTLLVHSVDDLRRSGSHFFMDWLCSVRENQLVQKVGISIYDQSDLDAIDLSFVDVVQLPLSLYDQRLLVDSTLNLLSDNGIEIQARSIFLQGLLLASSSRWPSWSSKQAIAHHRHLEELSSGLECDLIDIAISFIKSQDILSSVVVGICDIDQAIKLLTAWSSQTLPKSIRWEEWAIDDKIIDPRLWPC